MEAVRAAMALVALAEEAAEAALRDSRSQLAVVVDCGSWRLRRGHLTKTLRSFAWWNRLAALSVGGDGSSCDGVSGVGYRGDGVGSRRYQIAAAADRSSWRWRFAALFLLVVPIGISVMTTLCPRSVLNSTCITNNDFYPANYYC